MANKVKRKRRLRRSIVQRQREVEMLRLERAWRNIFVKAGILNGDA